MLDLNDLRVFERVAQLLSFSAAARALGLPKSSVSRSIARLEAGLGTRLLQRTTREVVLMPAGEGLRDRCGAILGQVEEAVDYVESLKATPRGKLKVSTGVGFGINVLAELLPAFVERFPDVDVTLDLASQHAAVVADSVDVAIRLGPLTDSALVATKLGSMRRYLCAAPSYLDRHGIPKSVEDLVHHQAIEMPAPDGRSRSWLLTNGVRTIKVDPHTRICVNEALTIHKLVLGGAGLGIISGYLCAPGLAAGRLVRLLPGWTPPPVDVSLVFPSGREMAPAVRAFADFMKEVSVPGQSWQNDPDGPGTA